ncbi:SRPBCC family protein [Actinoplanes sp. NPDC049681]|uniref:SRPBCC family protein n=1 Tax=Actinoplanes sp. NPDC049681 TaxID=3363905 RepID=UPI00379909A7
MRTPTLLAAAVLTAAAVAGSPPVRHRMLTWGATPEEAAGPLAGDDLLPDAPLISTRAITIGAQPAAVWPWLVQMGSGRGGAYTYDWIENLFGLNMHSADEVLPQFQQLTVGDVLPLGATGPAMRVEICDRERTLAIRSTDGAWVWIFALRPEAGGTRLISRNRIRISGAGPVRRFLYDLVMTPGSLVMERRMLLGIKQRAERPGAHHPASSASSGRTGLCLGASRKAPARPPSSPPADQAQAGPAAHR